MRAQRGFIRLAYVAVLFMFGVVLWLIWQSRAGTPFTDAVGLDTALVDYFAAAGIRNAHVVTQSIRERKDGAARWVEYYRELRVPRQIDLPKLVDGIRALARTRGMACLVEAAGRKQVVKISVRGRLVSHLLLAPEQDAATAVVPAKPKPAKQPVEMPVRAALVIDDVGPSRAIDGYLSLGVPVTFAILPFETYSTKIAGQLHAQKIPYILHLPMEPQKYPAVNPGRGALLVRMSPAEIMAATDAALARVPHARGVSNHMGSAFTEREDSLLVLSRHLKSKGLFLFDSVTTQHSAVRAAARKAGIRVLSNAIFLDIQDDPAYMRAQCRQFIRLAKKNGQAVAIGHIQKKHMLQVLREFVPVFAQEHITLVYLSDLLQREP